LENIETTTDAWASTSSLPLGVLSPVAETALRGKAVENADLVVEAIIESLKVKRDLFGFLDGKAK
jgi:3-hydroxyacyl-CoA dehydrogenase